MDHVTAGTTPDGALLRALRGIAATMLRGSQPADQDDAAASAALHLVSNWSRVLAADRPAAYAATCARNAMRDLGRAARRCRRRPAVDDEVVPAAGRCPIGWWPQELGLMVEDAHVAIQREHAAQPGAEVAEAAACITALLSGAGMHDPATDTLRRRRDRALHRLSRLLDQP